MVTCTNVPLNMFDEINSALQNLDKFNITNIWGLPIINIITIL